MPQVGKFEIIEQFGSGSTGTVYRGREAGTGRPFAIKTFHASISVEKGARERFYREARIAASLDHPHIVSVHHIGEDAGIAFMAMELLRGSDFRQLIERRDDVALRVKITAMAQICEALAHAHRHGIVHRDLKPSNLFLLADGRAKVVDFGIAQLPTSYLTRTGATLSAANYMAPEVIGGLTSDGRADLFSAAAVFFEFLTFHHPFEGNLIPRRIVETAPDSLLSRDPGLPAILGQILNRALSRDPGDRYATGDEFAADLRAVANAITNGSTDIANLRLPSETASAGPPPVQAPDLFVPAFGSTAAGDQAWRVNRMLKLLEMFDPQVRAGQSQAARMTLAELQSVVGSDPRFLETLEKCRAQLARGELQESSRAEPLAQTSAPQTPTPRTNPSIVRWPRPAAITDKLEADKKRLTLVVAGVLFAAVLLIVAPMRFRGTRPEPFVATARVATSQVRILSKPSDTASEVVSKTRGAEMNVLALPKNLGQEWVHVQPHEGEAYSHPGYVHAADLMDWNAKDAVAALALARMSGPMEAGSEGEIRMQIGRFNEIATTYAGKPVAAEASLNAIKLELALAQRAKESGQPAGDWSASLSELTSRTEELRKTASVQRESDDLLRKIHDLIAEKTPIASAGTSGPAGASGTNTGTTGAAPAALNTPPSVPAGPTDDEITALLESADQMRREHRYNDARRVVLRTLRAQPKNNDAQVLLKKIDAAVELEKSSQ
jgi:serine/threonine protein kinase